MEKSKYYYDYCRNKEDCECENPCSSRVPAYYVGRNGMMAKDVINEFDLSYNCGTACTYILRNSKKHKSPIECLKKAIAHLEFEIEQLENNK